MDNVSQIGKYIRKASDNADFSLKRSVRVEPSYERIRDLFDADNPFVSKIETPGNMEQTFLSLQFGKKLPSTTCCGDCYCGSTESYTSDNLIDDNIYLNTAYVPGSTVVYINGSRATQGVEYTESSPENKQLTILVPMSSITVSYVYTVGNCEDGTTVCEDTLDCIPDGFYTGLATVFSDRFDRPRSQETTGGCGGWISNFLTVDGVSTYDIEFVGNEGAGAASFPSSIQASPGGFNRLVGSQWEVLVLSENGGSSGIGISVTNGRGQSAGVSKVELTGPNTQYTMFSNSYKYEQDDAVPPTFMDIDSYTVSPVGTHTYEDGVSYFHRLIQTLDGLEYRIWKEGFDESTATSYTISTQVNNPPQSGDVHEPCPIQMQRVTFTGSMRAVKIGAALDDGVYFDGDGAGGSNSWHGELCTVNPDGKIRFQHCTTDTISVVAVGNTAPEAAMGWSFSHFDAGTPGALLDYVEEIGTISTSVGQAGHLVISGFIRAGLYNPQFSVPIQIKSFDLGPFVGPAQPNFTQHGFTGGQVIYSTTVPTDGQLYPFTVRIPTNEYFVARWGLSIVNPYAIPPTLPFKSGSVLFPNNHAIAVTLRELKVYAESSAICTADDYCGDCLSSRCQEVVDGFVGTDTGFAATGSVYTRNPQHGPPIEVDQDADTRLTYAGGTMTFDTEAPHTGRTVELHYGSILDCVSNVLDSSFDLPPREDGGADIKFDFYSNNLTMDGNNYAELDIYGWNAGPFAWLELDGGAVTWNSGEVDVTNLPTISAATWYTMRIQNYYEAGQYYWKAKVWPSDSSEPGWQVVDNYPELYKAFTIALYNDDNVSTHEWKLRNLTISRIGFEGHTDTDSGGGSTPIGGGTGGGGDGGVVTPPPPPPPPDDSGSGGSGGTGSGGTGSGGGGPAGSFLSYPASAKILLNGISGSSGSPYIIERKSFDTLGADVEAIRLVNCSWVIIRNCDFRNVAQCITVLDSDNIFVEDCRYLNIIGPHERVGKNRANFVQMIRTTNGHIRRNKGKGGDTEDIISMFKSGGTSGNIFYIANNHFQGTNWDSTSGTAVLLGDYGGSYTYVQDNIFLNPGQVGIGVAGGINNKVLRNIVYGEQRPYSNVGIYVSVFGSYTGPFGPHEVRDNRIYWKKADGTNNSTWYSKSSYGDTEPIGWDDNVRNDTTLSESALQVVL